MACRPMFAAIRRRLCLMVMTLAPALAMAAGAPVAAQDKVARLTSLDWPPFSDSTAADQGAAVAVAKAAFAAMGYALQVDFYPWNRAVNLVRAGTRYHGYFPEYDGEAVRQEFVVSVPLGSSPLGFAEPAGKPVSWSTLMDLKGLRLGMVDGYINTAELDALVNAGDLTAEKVNADTINLRKLVVGRLDLAVIDKAVMRHLLRTDAILKDAPSMVRFNDHVLEDKTLHIAFRNDEAGQEMAGIFAQGLARIDARAMLSRVLAD